ncbi:MAG TPA: SGNH/GDSL hydrolase family protein [Chitinophagales bacterium]|nr:SGNH/GDSL hydrolase family protein [Chitinophagales bacterium]
MAAKLVKTLLINLLTVAVLLVVIELVSRVVLRKVYDREFDSSLIVENKYGSSSGLRAMASAKVWGQPFTTDSNGCRATQAQRPNKNKWLYIGDSVTEGVGVDDSSTFANQCAKQFSDFNILNYSLIGYSTPDYLNVLKTVLPGDTSIELVTLFYCLNDVYGSAKTKDLPVMAKQNWMGQINGLLQNSCATYKLIKLFFYRNSNRYFTYDLQFYKENDPHFTQAMADLNSCDSLCKYYNVYFNVVALPYQSQLKDKDFTPQQLVKQYCAAHEIEFSDAAEHLAKDADPNGLYLFADEIHFSQKGHRAIADFLSE